MAGVTRRTFIETVAAGAASCALGPRILSGQSNEKQQDAEDLPRPTAVQLAWQQAELGLLYCYELHTFMPGCYKQSVNQKKKLDIGLFNPTGLDTDQWMEAAKVSGAKFAILTASHESGFRLWQSDANPFSLKSSKWGGGKRDIVKEFVDSCRRAGIKPGVYLGTRWNAQLGVLAFKVTKGSPVTQAEYNRMIEKEVEEVCTRYGDLFELWFDGGSLGKAAGGPDVLSVFEKHQKNCLFYHSHERADARWGGTETGTVGYPCWATVPSKSSARKMPSSERRAVRRHGDPDGKCWRPAMSDAPLRNHEWFWEPNDEHKIRPLQDLVEMHYHSVGRNSTLILGATPDTRGLMPNADIQRLGEFGNEIRRRFKNLVGQTSGQGETIELALERPRQVDHVVIMEDIVHGERVRAYEIEGLVQGNTWQKLCDGISIGHKRIQQFEPIEVAKVRFRSTKSVATPRIRNLAVYG